MPPAGYVGAPLRRGINSPAPGCEDKGPGIRVQHAGSSREENLQF